MKFSDLVSSVCEIRPHKTDLLIIISSFNNLGLVKRHLALLSRQTFQNFNVFLVLGTPFDDGALAAHVRRRRFQFGVILAKENDLRGCSGAFFTGQKYALEKGYDNVIMADDDCMPVDRKLIKELYKNRGKRYVAPTTVFLEGQYRKKGFVAGPTQYSLYSSDVFSEYGLYYLPLFHGADDGEYMERVKLKPCHIKNFTEHPYISGMRLFSMFDRQWLFLIQALIILKAWRAAAYNLLQFALMVAISIVFMPGYGRRIAAKADLLLLAYKYGKEAGGELRSGFEKEMFAPGKGFFSGFVAVKESNASYIDEPAPSKLLSIALGSATLFRKKVVVERTHSFIRVFIIAAFAKKLYVKVKDAKYLQFSDNSSPFLHLARLLVFPPVLLAQALLCAAFMLIKAVRQPRTLSYGLE
jgi:hypothetical protein